MKLRDFIETPAFVIIVTFSIGIGAVVWWQFKPYCPEWSQLLSIGMAISCCAIATFSALHEINKRTKKK